MEITIIFFSILGIGALILMAVSLYFERAEKILKNSIPLDGSLKSLLVAYKAYHDGKRDEKVENDQLLLIEFIVKLNFTSDDIKHMRVVEEDNGNVYILSGTRGMIFDIHRNVIYERNQCTLMKGKDYLPELEEYLRKYIKGE